MRLKNLCLPKTTVTRVTLTLTLTLVIVGSSVLLYVKGRSGVISPGLNMVRSAFRGSWMNNASHPHTNPVGRHRRWGDKADTDRRRARDPWFNPPNCTVLESLSRPDPSVRQAYDRSVVCGPQASDRDIFCRLFFLQNGLTDYGDCVRADDDTTVPRIVYFVIFGKYTFQFCHYVSVMAAKRHVTPSALYVIGDAHPVGYWWQRLIKDCKGVCFVYRPCPGAINGQKVIFPHHWSDIVRLQVLLLNGGLYLDLDMVLTRDPGPLLTYNVTMGLVESITGMGNAFIAAKRNLPFVQDWYARYRHFSNSLQRYFYNSLRVPWELWRENATRLHVERERLYGPNYYEADKLFKGWDYDWRQNYVVHVWTNGNPVPRSEEEVQISNTTIAQVFRNALYGDPAPR
ncbi:hypothetical protein ACOMHN_011876 [Nucella lapillus]